ncbi:vWA domain-containing protein [Haloarchaeobius sp. DFWS5]|uniref:vWA domain-containing protein n=1 Tax=Haloarchaeobius sp. DFWS5 TaxID=3446114 RepID=UPI003EBF3366
MWSPHTHRDATNRGVSEITGVVILVGIVVAGAAMLFVSGTAVSNGVQDSTEVQSAEMVMEDVDARLGSLALGSSAAGDELQLGSMSPPDTEIVQTGSIALRVNDLPACEATLPLSALEYRHERGTTIAYEGGAIWRSSASGTVELDAPDLRYRDGTLHLSVVHLAGAVDDETLAVRKNTTQSRQMTARVKENLFAGSCGQAQNVDNITITVESDYHEAWRTHLEAEFEGATVTTPAPDTVRVVVSKSMLPDRLDHGSNEVVDFTNPDTTDGDVATVPSDDDRLSVDKGAGNEYDVSVELLGTANAYTETATTRTNGPGDPLVGWNNSTLALPGTGSVSVPYEVPVYETVWNNTTRREHTDAVPPLEVVFVVDESGSMRGSKLSHAKSATRHFLDTVRRNQSHEVGVVGYSTRYLWDSTPQERWCYQQGNPYECPIFTQRYQDLTTNFDGAKAQVQRLRADGGTPVGDGLADAINMLESQGDGADNQVIVLLSDGQNTQQTTDPRYAATLAAQQNITIHSVGVGSGVDASLLSDVATTAGGNYYDVDRSTELDGLFEQIARNETTEIIHVNRSEQVYRGTVVRYHEWDETDAANAEQLVQDVEFTASVERTLTADEAANLSVGDTVSVTGTNTTTVSGTERVSVDFTRTTFDEATMQNVTETVSVPMTLSFSETRTVPVDDSVVLQSRHLTPTTTTSGRYLVHRPTTLTADVGGTTKSLWSGQNLNNWTAGQTYPAVGFTVDDGQTTTLSPQFRDCLANTTTGGSTTIGGETYEDAACTQLGGLNLTDDESTVRFYANDTVIADTSSLAWQDSLSSMLTTRSGDQYYRMDGGTMRTANLCANEVIAVVSAEDRGGVTDANNLVLKLSVGSCTEQPDSVLTVDVSQVVTENDSRLVTPSVVSSPTVEAVGDSARLVSSGPAGTVGPVAPRARLA